MFFFIVLQSQEADYHGEQCNTLEKGCDNDHIGSNIVDRFRLTGDSLHGCSTEWRVSARGSARCYSCAGLLPAVKWKVT